MDNQDANTNGTSMSQELEACKEKLEFLGRAIVVLLVFIKEFSLDLDEIHADKFKEEIDKLNEKINSDIKLKKIESEFEDRKKTIYNYISRLKRYVDDREKELKKIIDMLIKAMATLGTDNQAFNQKIYAQSEKIGQITLLDDIKNIKSALETEIGQLRGTIKEKQRLDRENMDKLSSRVDILNLELEKAKAESLTDGLTGAYNRAAFDQMIKALVERNSITRAPFCMMFLDIDNFKEINDLYGHPIGDRVLLALSQKCQEDIRKDDFFARIGGDEFAILMKGSALRNAQKKAKQICKAIGSTRYSLSSEDQSSVLSFTISIGVSAFRDGDTVESLTDRTDKALYAAKHSGRSRVSSEKDI